jgi:hypothetical protein
MVKIFKIKLLIFFVALLVIAKLYWFPITVFSISLPNSSFFHDKDFKSLLIDLHACKKYTGGYETAHSTDFDFIGEPRFKSHSYVWIEVNNQWNGISCMTALRDSLEFYHLGGYYKAVANDEFFVRVDNFRIEQVALGKTNGIRYIILLILVALILKRVDV